MSCWQLLVLSALLTAVISLCSVDSCQFHPVLMTAVSIFLLCWHLSVSPCSFQFLPSVLLTAVTFSTVLLTAVMVSTVLLAAVGDSDTSGRPTWHGHEWHIRPLRQGLPGPRQEEEVWDQGAPQNAQPRLQRDLHLQGQYSSFDFEIDCLLTETVSNRKRKRTRGMRLCELSYFVLTEFSP